MQSLRFFWLYGVLAVSLSQTVASQDTAMLDKLEAQLRQDPANPRLLAARGVVLSELNRVAESLQSFDKALAISPKFLLALEGAAQVAYRNSDPRASGYLNRILTQDRENQTAHAMLAALAFEGHDCRAAAEHFAHARAAVNQSAEAQQQWGDCLLDLRQSQDAVDHLRRSFQLKPSPSTQMSLSWALHLSGHNNQAERELQSLPPNASTLHLHAVIYADEHKFPAAVAAYREALRLNPKDQQTYLDLVSLCLDHQSFDIAQDIVNAGLVALPNSAALYTLRGAISAQFAHMEEAAADFEKARSLQPNQLYSDAGLSLLFEQQNQIDEAIAVVRKRIAQAPDDPSLQFLLGDLLLKSHSPTREQESEAKEHLLHALHAQPDLSRAYALLGKIALRDGRNTEAIHQLKLALKYDPKDKIALNQLVMAYRKSGMPDQAHAAAQELQKQLADARQTEVSKNSVRFVRPSEEQHPSVR